jgi:predicted ATP-grasp superfamily ATP-dependent carboligase
MFRIAVLGKYPDSLNHQDCPYFTGSIIHRSPRRFFMARILVPEYMGQQVLSGIRALKSDGDTVDVAFDLSIIEKGIFKSRAIRRIFEIPSSSLDEDGYIRGIRSLIADKGYHVLMPFGLGSYYCISKHAAELQSDVAFMVPGFEAFSIANDKQKSAALCKSIGVETPQIFSDYSESDISALAKEVKFPVVVKARSGMGVEACLRYANNADELKSAYDEISSLKSKVAFDGSNPLIQEFIPGYIHDACTLTRKGSVVAALSQVRLLMYPIYGGVGAINVTTREDELIKQASAVLEAIGWNGPAQVEFKLDERDGKYKFIELNPKLWGTLDLSIKAGMNFPGMIRDICLNGEMKSKVQYKEGVRYIFRYSQEYLARKQLHSDGIVPDYFEDARYPSSVVYNDFDPEDPVPDVVRALKIMIKSTIKPLSKVNANIPLDKVLGKK